MRLFRKTIVLACTIFGTSCNTASVTKSVESFHFPKLSVDEDGIVVPAQIIGTPKVLENCLVLDTRSIKYLLVWSHESNLKKSGNDIIVENIRDDQNQISNITFKNRLSIVGTILPTNFFGIKDYDFSTPSLCEPMPIIEVYSANKP